MDRELANEMEPGVHKGLYSDNYQCCGSRFLMPLWYKVPQQDVIECLGCRVMVFRVFGIGFGCRI